MTDESASDPKPETVPAGRPSSGLGELGKTTSSRSWLALLTAAIVVAGALFWGAFGTIPVQTSLNATISTGSFPIEIAAGVAGTVSIPTSQLKSVVNENVSTNTNNIKKGQLLMSIKPFSGGTPVKITTPQEMEVGLRVVQGSPVEPTTVVASGAPSGKTTGDQADVYAFLSQSEIKTVRQADKLTVSPSAPNLASEPVPIKLFFVNPVSSSVQLIVQLTGNSVYAKNAYQAAGGAPYQVVFHYVNASDANKVNAMTNATITVTKSDSHPLSLLFGS
jgi:hypothetical protein